GQISKQLARAVDRVMTEGSLYDRELAALAIKQACGDLIEAIFLLRAYRSTLLRFGTSEPVDTGSMAIRRRISATFKDLPGGQLLGPTFDDTNRLLEPQTDDAAEPPAVSAHDMGSMPRVTDLLAADKLIEAPAGDNSGRPAGDLARDSLEFPAERDLCLQN